MRKFVLSLLVPAAVCLAQAPATDTAAPTRAVVGGSGGGFISAMPSPLGANATFFFRSGEFSFDRNVVKGQPYTADAVTTRVQTLADGNRITSTESAQVARDSEGRTRREQVLGVPPGADRSGASPKIVFINDPVAQVNYVLEPDHTARKMPVPKAIGYQQMDDSISAKGVVPSGAAMGTFNTGIVSSGAAVATLDTAVAPPLRAGLGGEASSVEDLGSQTIESVQAEGKRTTTTIPAGKIGNEQPIVITYERWYSPDLQTVVMTRRSDPRVGEETFQLTNIQRAEPPASMFEVPSDYKIAEPSDAVRQITIKQ